MKKVTRLFAFTTILVGTSTASLAGLGVTFVNNDHLPTMAVPDPTDPDTIYTVGRYGKLKTLKNFEYLPLEESFAVLPPAMLATGGERAVNSLTFSPNYVSDGKCYISYCRAGDGANVIAEYQRSESNPYQIDLGTARTIMIIPNSEPFHYGGGAKFGPDGCLWVFKGDGENDPSSQDPTLLNGKILRIDPFTDDFPLDPERNYGIPADNPFLDGNPVSGPAEAVHFGFRNPWRWCWDEPSRGGSGALLIGDVGADSWEEINFIPAKAMGLNFGWPHFEGSQPFQTHVPLAFEPAVHPIAQFPHPDFRAVVGGPIYRGLGLGIEMYGRYFYADVITQKVYSAKLTFGDYGDSAVMSDIINHTPELLAYSNPLGQIWSMDVDSEGELLIVGANRVYKVFSDSLTTPRSINVGIEFSDLASVEARPSYVTVTVEKLGFSVSFQASPNAIGEFRIPLTSGKQTVRVKCGTFLSEHTSVDTGGNYSPKIDFSLVNGDANGDDSIDIADFSLLSAAFGSSLGDPGYQRNADLDGDGEVGIADYAIISANYGESR
ncbi:MAG: PQQ-dependent sugar dehydrogenase [Fimbriimonadaceae bacterium]|nr:PQQ-dependent sugar dehydrogenase [Fimbriimonadaceae bacterium]